MRCFYLSPSEWHEPWRLQGQEARHLVKVLRIRPGEKIRMVNGVGDEGIFSVTGTEKNAVLLEAETMIHHQRPPGGVTLALGYGKALRRGWLMEKAVELEASGLWFWEAEYSQTKMPDEVKDGWLGQMEAGAKQSANPWLPGLRLVSGGVDGLIREKGSFARAFFLWENEDNHLLNPEELALSGETLVVLGPEGGFSPSEAKALRDAGFIPASLGKRILRWETAALLCLGLAWFARQGR